MLFTLYYKIYIFKKGIFRISRIRSNCSSCNLKAPDNCTRLHSLFFFFRFPFVRLLLYSSLFIFIFLLLFTLFLLDDNVEILKTNWYHQNQNCYSQQLPMEDDQDVVDDSNGWLHLVRVVHSVDFDSSSSSCYYHHHQQYCYYYYYEVVHDGNHIVDQWNVNFSQVV